MDDFTTVFLFTDNTRDVFSSSIWLIGFGIFAAVTGIAILIWNLFLDHSIKSRERISRSITTVIWFLVGIGIFVRGLNNRTMYEQSYQSILNIYNNHQYKVVEGPVHVLHEQPAGGHAKGDIIEVGGTQLEISHFVVSFGYKDTIAYNGVLKDNVYARIYYMKDDWLHTDMILRIDLKN